MNILASKLLLSACFGLVFFLGELDKERKIGFYFLQTKLSSHTPGQPFIATKSNIFVHIKNAKKYGSDLVFNMTALVMKGVSTCHISLPLISHNGL